MGILVTSRDDNKFYFSETNIGKSITSSDTPWAQNARKYLLDYHQNMITFGEVATEAGAKLVSTNKCDIDLSNNKLEKDTFIKILSRKIPN